MGNDILDWCIEHLMPWLVLALVIGFLLAIAVGIYAAMKKSESPKFTLYKSEWHCAQSHIESSTTYVMIGKVMSPITTHSTVCTQWNKNP